LQVSKLQKDHLNQQITVCFSDECIKVVFPVEYLFTLYMY